MASSLTWVVSESLSINIYFLFSLLISFCKLLFGMLEFVLGKLLSLWEPQQIADLRLASTVVSVRQFTPILQM